MLKRISTIVLCIGGIGGCIIGGYNLFALCYLLITSKPIENGYGTAALLGILIAILCFSQAYLLVSNQKLREEIDILNNRLDRIATKTSKMDI